MDAKYWFTKAAVESVIAKACERHDLTYEAALHAERAVYFLALGLKELALSMGATDPLVR